MPRNYTGEWTGGRITTKRGRLVYLIERMIDGHAYQVAVPAEKDPEAELALFYRNPGGYEAEHKAQRRNALAADAVLLDDPTVQGYLDYATNKLKRTPEHVNDQQAYLADWAEKLAGRDLRHVTIREYKALLTAWGPVAERKRIIALRSFTKYLRKELAILPAKLDESLQLAVPQPIPAKTVKTKGYTIPHVDGIYAAIGSQAVRDVFRLAAVAGMHKREIDRVARGEGIVTPVKGHGAIAGTVTFYHKKKRGKHVISVSTETLAAALRLQAPKGKSARGKQLANAPSTYWCRKEIERAAEATGLGFIQLSELRHSFVTWRHVAKRIMPKKGHGLSLQEMAEVTGHAATTARDFYDGSEIMPLVVFPTLKLRHPKDPRPLRPSVSASGSRSRSPGRSGAAASGAARARATASR